MLVNWSSSPYKKWSVDNYIKVPKELLDQSIWNNGKPFSEGQAFIQFMRWAIEMGDDCHFINGYMVTLKPGEFIMPQRKMAESMNWPQATVNRFLKKLVKMNQCRINSESKMTRVSIAIMEVTQEPESIVNQEVNQSTSLFDNSIGSGINSTKGTNSTNSNNNIYTNTTSNNSNYINNNTSLINDNKNSKPKTSPNKQKKQTHVARPKDISMVIDYFKEKGIDNAEEEGTKFWNYYEMTNWFSGKAKIKVWRMAVANWIIRKKDMSPGGKQAPKQERFRKTPRGEWIAYCTNKNSSHHGESLFFSKLWELTQSCKKCGHDLTHKRPEPIKKGQGENHAKEEELITFKEFQAREKESPEGRRTSERGGQLLSDILGPMLQQG